ncbi:MAG: FecR domain-containing protein, partial [Kordiimonas sp.]
MVEVITDWLRYLCAGWVGNMINRDTKHIAPSILDEAAEWQVKLSSEAVTDADIASHMEWLLADPIHVEAEEIVAATINVSTEFETAARKAFSDDFEAENVNLEEKSFWSRLLGSSAGLPSGIAIVAVAALLFFTIVPNTEQRSLPDTEQTYVAESGRVESVKLDDGSIIALFSNSEISVSMSSDTRVVELKRGRAFFDVRSDKNRPFLVNTAARQVKVVGTRFEVVRGKQFERVSVNEGLVSVDTLFDQSTPEAASTPVLIEPGMVALYSRSQMVPMLSTKDANNVGAWSGGVLTYRN